MATQKTADEMNIHEARARIKEVHAKGRRATTQDMGNARAALAAFRTIPDPWQVPNSRKRKR